MWTRFKTAWRETIEVAELHPKRTATALIGLGVSIFYSLGTGDVEGAADTLLVSLMTGLGALALWVVPVFIWAWIRAPLKIQMASAKSSLLLRDPDGIYQHERVVGKVFQHAFDDAGGVVSFAAINDAISFNGNEPFEFRDYRLVKKSEDAYRETGFGGQMTNASYKNVIARIIGRL